MPHFDVILTTGRSTKGRKSIAHHFYWTWMPCSFRLKSDFFLRFMFFSLFLLCLSLRIKSINAGSVFDMWMSFGINGKGQKKKRKRRQSVLLSKIFWHKKLKNRPLQQLPKLMRHSCFKHIMDDIEKSSHSISKSIEFGGRRDIIRTALFFAVLCLSIG